MEEGDRVVALFGPAAFAEREVTPDVVATLRRLLERAEAGEVVGVVAVATHWDGVGGRSWAGKLSYAALGVLAVTQHELHVIKAAEP